MADELVGRMIVKTAAVRVDGRLVVWLTMDDGSKLEAVDPWVEFDELGEKVFCARQWKVREG